MIRQATLRDLDAVVALRLALLREHPEHPLYGRLRPDAEERARDLYAQQLQSTNEAVFVFCERDDIIGILRCVESLNSPLLDPPKYCYVSSVYVIPRARRRGILRALFARAVDWAKHRGLDEMRLHNVSTNPLASRAWDALGFGIVEHVRVRTLA
ncbi:MAG: GCN5-related N-acetyltransferase [Gemmatimonadetes bacterium]|nr:GCN5-related N-acetyltransferase [Gemmatimonadota bacterium]